MSSHPSAEEEPVSAQKETSSGEECRDSGQSQLTMDSTALEDDGCVFDSPPTVIDVNTPLPSDTCHSEQPSENSEPKGAREEDTCIEEEETVETIIVGGNIHAGSSPTAEDVQSDQETGISDGTDICVSAEI